MPILVITGLTDEQIASEAVRCGAEDYLVKGQTDARSMVRAIRYAIDRKLAEEALKAAKDSAECAKAAAEQANRAKDHFLAVLSHELRTPLTPVVMGLSMLQDRPDLDPAIRETLEMVRRNVELEARLIDDLLDVSRIAQGKIELQPQRRRVVYGHPAGGRGLQARHRGAEAALRRGPGTGRAVLGRGRRAPAAAGLLEPAEERHQVHAARRMRGHPLPAGCEEHVVVEVNDSGIGIEPEALSRIFNAFEQAERSITQQFGGLGLGLAISKALVEMHGGRIEAHSEGRGKGATFRVRLPLTAPAGQREAAAARRAPAACRPPLAHLAGRRPRRHGQVDADGADRRRPHRRNGRRRRHGLGIGRPTRL